MSTLTGNRIFIQTFGCPKNEVDSRTLRAELVRMGYVTVPTAEKADLIILNTCSFINDARRESIDGIFEAIQVKNNSDEEKKICVIGCLPSLYEKELKAEIPEMDFSWGADRFQECAHAIADTFPHSGSLQSRGESRKEVRTHPYEYLRVSRGCSRSCAFCSIPRIRGKYSEYQLSHIKEQMEHIREAGGTPPEVILVAQDMTSTRPEFMRETLEYLSGIKEIHWIRVMYFFPDRRIFPLMDLWKDFPKLVSYMDIPFQHISSAILEKMNRPGDVGLFREILSHAHSLREDIEIRTSFILGFPDETDKDVETIIRFLAEQPRIQKVALFPYSHEENSPSHSLNKDNISASKKANRVNRVREAFLESRKGYRESLIGKTEKMIIDRVGKKEIIARRSQDAPEVDELVFIDTNKSIKNSVGDIVDVQLEYPMEYDWTGSIIRE